MSSTALHRVAASVCALLVISCTDSDTCSSQATTPQTDCTSFVCEMETGMIRMMRDMHANGYTGNADTDFLAMMIPHHEGAIDMARLVLLHGNDPLVRRLAEDIIATQAVEIQGMRERYALINGETDREEDGSVVLGATRGR